MKRALYRLLINWRQASDRPLPGWLRSACSRDASLDAERKQGDALSNALRQKPAEKSNPFAEYGSMADRVLRQITEEDYNAAREESESGYAPFAWVAVWRRASIVAVACLIAVAGFRWWQSGNSILQQENPNGSANVANATDTPKPRIVVIEAPVRLPDLPDAKRLATLESEISNPLDQEIEYVISDAKGALDFLTNSFVPKRFLESGTTSSRRSNDRA